MLIRSNARDPLPLAPGLVLNPGVDTPVPDAEWDALSRLAVVQAWIRAKVLTIVAPDPAPVPDEKDALIAELAGYGIPRTRRSSLETLRAQAEAMRQQTNGGEQGAEGA